MMHKDIKMPLKSNQASEWAASWHEKLIHRAINIFIVFSLPMIMSFTAHYCFFSLIFIERLSTLGHKSRFVKAKTKSKFVEK